MWKQPAGDGLGFNNNYAPVTLGPDGTAYVGVLGGLVALRDRTPPARVRRPDGATGAQAPKLLLGLYGLHRRNTPRRTCAPRGVRALVAGRDRRNVRRVVFTFGPRVGVLRMRSDSRPPFEVRLRRRSLRSRSTYSVRAAITMNDGRRVRLTRRFRAC